MCARQITALRSPNALHAGVETRVELRDARADRRGSVQPAILDWYERAGRSIAFRRTKDPYAVLVSETMAQQTQIGRVEPAWERFMAEFPTIRALAAAPAADVLRAWRGLGYNRRALNLHRAARAVVERFGGELPRSVVALEELPGIGPYTARAVAAIAFGAPVGAVDTNVRRVLGRIVLGQAEAANDAAMQRLADEFAPVDAAGPWTHALMDIGATLCRPRHPNCAACPAAAWCRYAAAGVDDRASDGASARTGPAAAHGRIPPSSRPHAPVRFEATTRWLRGRILDRLRAADGEHWATVDGPIGSHPAPVVQSMLLVLEAEGLLEIDPTDATRARLPR